jgi:hypothetical protein
VFLFGKPKGKQSAFLQQPGQLVFEPFIITHPNGSDSKNADLVSVLILVAVEAQDLVIRTDPGEVEARVRVTVPGGGQEGGKDLVFPYETHKIIVPAKGLIILFNAF